MAEPFATTTDVAVRLGRDESDFSTVDTARIEALIVDASALVIQHIGTDYEGVENPPIVKAVVCQVVGRAFGVTPDATGIQQEGLGSYNYSIGSAAASGALGLLPAEIAALDGLAAVASTGGQIGMINLGNWAEPA